MDGTVIATLGEGRFGKVQCVKRINEGAEVVAVKTYNRQKATEMGRVTRILQEKAVLQLLNVGNLYWILDAVMPRYSLPDACYFVSTSAHTSRGTSTLLKMMNHFTL